MAGKLVSLRLGRTHLHSANNDTFSAVVCSWLWDTLSMQLTNYDGVNCLLL